MKTGHHVVAVFVDLQKAFDTVDQDILLQKLEKMGLRGPANKLIKSYLDNRYQFTSVNKQESSRRSIKVGITQGSVLGPLMYILYVESIAMLQMQCKYFMFADDTALVFSEKNEDELEQNIQNSLNLFYEWLCANKLFLNEEKSVYMRFKAKNKEINPLTINIKGRQMDEVKQYRYLGLTIDENLSWENHTESIFKKLISLISAIKHVSEYLNIKCKMNFYNACINSVFTYMAPIWANTSTKNINRMQRLQNRAVKNIFNLPYDTRSKDLYEQLPCVPIKSLVIQEQCKLIFRINQNMLKSQVITKKNKEKTNYRMRRPNDFAITSKVKSERAKKSPIYASSNTFNQLPEHIKNIENYNIFKKTLKRHILSLNIY